MAAPATDPAGLVVRTIWIEHMVKVFADHSGRASRAGVRMVSLTSGENLHRVTNDRVARMDCDRSGCAVGAPIMREPVDELPRVLPYALQMMPELLVRAPRTECIHQHVVPGD